jgi:para-nitrobenzyl esterase
MIVGNTREETKLFASMLALSPALGGKPGLIVDDATRFRMMMAFKPGDVLTEGQLINAAYLPATAPTTGYNARLARLNDLFFVPNAEAMLNALSSHTGKVWRYSFDWAQEPAPWNTVYGASHLMDLPFVFGNFGPSVFANAINSTANEGGRLALSRAMMAALGAFAWRGDPNHAELGVAWPAYPKCLTLDATLQDKKLAVR